MRSPTAKESHSDIQWEKTKQLDKKSWIKDLSIELCFAFTFVTGITFEYLFGCGVNAFLISGILSFFYLISAPKHDNIPMFSHCYPIIGNYFWILKNFNKFLPSQYQEFIDYSKKYNSGKRVPMLASSLPTRSPMVIVTDPLLVDIIFRKQFGDAIKDSKQYEVLRPLLGYGIFAANGKVWKVSFLIFLIFLISNFCCLLTFVL